MGSALEDFVETVSAAPNDLVVWEAMNTFAENCGFSDCSLVTASSSKKSFVNPRTITSYSAEFARAYNDEGMGEIDPFLHFHCHDMSIKRIVSKDLSSFPKASKMHQLFLDHVAANGAAGGVGIPVRMRDQEIFGGWIMSCRESEQAVDKLTGEHGDTIRLASVLAYERMVSLGLGSNNGDLLSERERECLLWLCAGLRVSMIANKIGVGESAVNLYIANAKLKLGARTREQAVARAILSGEISL